VQALRGDLGEARAGIGGPPPDRCRALTIRKREVAEAHAARMRDHCPRNADLIKVEKSAAAD
jgi:hypothetical protein